MSPVSPGRLAGHKMCPVHSRSDLFDQRLRGLLHSITSSCCAVLVLLDNFKQYVHAPCN